MRPGFAMPLLVVGTRTQPLDSCMTMARTKRSSRPFCPATDWMALPTSEVSCAELSVPQPFQPQL